MLLFFCIPAVCLAALLWKGANAIIDRYNRYEAYDAIILKAASRNGVDPALLKAVIWQESKFEPDTIGSKGEIGLMQIMPKFAAADWAKAHRRKQPSNGALADPELNIEIGSWYLGRAIRRWRVYRECETLALCEYNAGFQRADAWKPEQPSGSMKGRIKIDSTSGYVSKILNKRQEYAREFRKTSPEKGTR